MRRTADGSSCNTGPVEEDELLAEQMAFYRARAPIYDEWWQRTGPYDRGDEMAEQWDRQIDEVERSLRAFSVRGDVLELAGGTGWWTERLARSADHLTVVDSSPEVLELNRLRTGRTDVAYTVADLFTWVPDKSYDVVFFSFWLSHVPHERFASFWSMVRSCLAPGGRVFLIDNHSDPLPADIKDPYVLRYDTDRHLRRVEDGREFNVVKVMYEPRELETQLASLGWDAVDRGDPMVPVRFGPPEGRRNPALTAGNRPTSAGFLALAASSYPPFSSSLSPSEEPSSARLVP